jgi:hypothetical protein
MSGAMHEIGLKWFNGLSSGHEFEVIHYRRPMFAKVYIFLFFVCRYEMCFCALFLSFPLTSSGLSAMLSRERSMHRGDGIARRINEIVCLCFLNRHFTGRQGLNYASADMMGRRESQHLMIQVFYLQ